MLNPDLTDLLRKLGLELLSVNNIHHYDDVDIIDIYGTGKFKEGVTEIEFNINGILRKDFDPDKIAEILAILITIRDSESPAVKDLYEKLKATLNITA